MTSEESGSGPVEHVFETHVGSTMEFLRTHGFAEMPLERDFNGSWLQKTYVGKHVAFEFILDLREEVFESKIARVKEGRVATEFAVGPDGSVVRAHLREFLRRRGLVDSMLRNLGGLPFVEYVKARIEDDARLLQKFGADILADRPEIFGEFPKRAVAGPGKGKQKA